MKRARGFTLVELLTVSFIIAVLVAVMVPAVQMYRQRAQEQQTERYLIIIRMALTGYRQDFRDYPPSEPDMIDRNRPDVPKDAAWDYWGYKALFYYLNGPSGNGLSVTYGPWSAATRIWPPRVTGVPVDPNGPAFADTWGNAIEYYRAYRHRTAWDGTTRGKVTADIYPRACNVHLNGSGDYRYYLVTTYNTYAVGGYGLHVKIEKWLNGCTGYYDTAKDWRFNSVPVNADSFLLVAKGKDCLFGTEDDLGDVGEW